MEKLTSLAALRAGDMEKIQKLESELDRAAAHRHNYEEKGRKYKAAIEEVCAGRDYGNPCASFCARGHGPAFSHKAVCRTYQILLLAFINKEGLPFGGGKIRGEEKAHASRRTTEGSLLVQLLRRDESPFKEKEPCLGASLSSKMILVPCRLSIWCVP